MTLKEGRTIHAVLTKTAFAGVIGGIAALVGGFDSLFQCFLLLMALDLICGLAAAWKENTLNSAKGWQGTVRKVVSILIIILAIKMDEISGNHGVLRNTTLLYFISNEGLSVLENAGRLGVPLPAALKKALQTLKKE